MIPAPAAAAALAIVGVSVGIVGWGELDRRVRYEEGVEGTRCVVHRAFAEKGADLGDDWWGRWDAIRRAWWRPLFGAPF